LPVWKVVCKPPASNQVRTRRDSSSTQELDVPVAKDLVYSGRVRIDVLRPSPGIITIHLQRGEPEWVEGGVIGAVGKADHIIRRSNLTRARRKQCLIAVHQAEGSTQERERGHDNRWPLPTWKIIIKVRHFVPVLADPNGANSGRIHMTRRAVRAVEQKIG